MNKKYFWVELEEEANFQKMKEQAVSFRVWKFQAKTNFMYI